MEIKDVVKEKYGQAALRVSTGGSSCCGASPALDACDPITSNLYDASQTSGLPEQAVKASLGSVYRIESPAMYTTLMALPATQITAFQTGGDGRLYAATGNTGKVYEIGSGLEREGSIEI